MRVCVCAESITNDEECSIHEKNNFMYIKYDENCGAAM